MCMLADAKLYQVDLSANAGLSVFVAYNNENRLITPESFARNTGSVSLSADVKDIVGGDVEINLITENESYQKKNEK
jgi:hypothetical protein